MSKKNWSFNFKIECSFILIKIMFQYNEKNFFNLDIAHISSVVISSWNKKNANQITDRYNANEKKYLISLVGLDFL